MKKHMAVLLAICMVFIFQGTAMAAGDSQDSTSAETAAGYTEYTLADLYMTISLPADFLVVTRDTQTLPEALAQASMTLNGLQTAYKEENIYLEAFSSDTSLQLLVRMQDVGNQKTKDLQNLSETDLDAFAQNMVNQLNKNNTATFNDETVTEKYDGYSICRYGNTTYVQIPVEKTYGSTGETHGSMEYYTIKNGRMITIAENSLTGTLSDGQKTALDGIVQSAVFRSPALLETGFLASATGRIVLIAGAAAVVVIVAAVVHGRKKKRKLDKK